MIATVTDIHNNDELNQVLQLVSQHHGQLVEQETTGGMTTIRTEFKDGDNVTGFDIEVCDLGFNVDWNN